ncbi:MAG: TonB-dependent receptor [Bacteriovoracaceae bacterium]|nr:TonB-dependent receptor [Bacteriovoracaceae bacterium]
MRLILSWKRVRLFLFFSLIIHTGLALGGSVDLKGIVYEKGTLIPMADVNLYILPIGLKATTNKLGEFQFEKAPTGENEWIVNVTGYKRFKSKLTYQSNTTNLRIYLEKKSYVEFETTVVGKLEKKDPSKVSLSREEFLKAPGSNGDPVRALENLPGVLQTYDANVAIQGSPPESTRYLIEGHEIPFIFHFFGLNTVAVPETVDSIDFLSAGYGPEFGRANSGIINLNLRAPRTDRVHAMSFVDFTAAGGFVEGPIGDKGDKSFFLGGRYSYIGEVLKFGSEKFAENDGEDAPPPTFNTAPTYFDMNFTYHQKLSGRAKFKLAALASQDKVEAISFNGDGQDPTFTGRIFGRTRFFRLIPQFSYKINENSDFETSLGGGIDQRQFEPGGQTLDLVSTRLTWRSAYRNRFSKRYELTLGTDFVHESFDDTFSITSSFFNETDVEVPESIAEFLESNNDGSYLRQGYYMRNEIDLIDDKLIFSPNLRIDYFEGNKDFFIQPRGGLRYNFSKDMALSFNSGVYYQPNTPQNLALGTGNPDISPPNSIHHSLRFSRDFREGRSDGLVLTGGLFYKKLKDLVIQSSGTTSRNGALVSERINNGGEGNVKGLETLFRYKWERSFFSLGYTYTRSRRSDNGGPEYRARQDQTHNLNFTGNYNWDNYSLTSRLRFVTGLPYTPITSGVYYENGDVYIPVQGARLSERLNDFWQLDLRLDRKWIYDTWILSVYLDIQNVTNNKNEFGIAYSFDYSQSEPSTGLPILPTFGVRGEF